MFAKFIDVVQPVDFEDYGTFRILKIDGDETVVNIECEVRIDEEPGLPTSWCISCKGVQRHALKVGHVHSVKYSKEHALLIPFSSNTQRLSFRGVVENAAAVMGSLYRRHYEVFDGWIPFDEYLNSHDTSSLIAGGFGILAEGPAPVISAYDEVLRQYGIQTTVSGDRKPTYWNRGASVFYPELTALVFDRSDRTYVVAERFEAKSF